MSLAGAIVIALTATHFCAKAQSPEPVELDTVVVTASKAHRRVTSEVLLAGYTSADFERRGVADVADALRRLPGVNLRDYGGLGGLKTVSLRGLGTQHTAVVYDGIVLSDCQNGEVDLGRYSLDNVKSLSVVMGDNSDIFQPARLAASAASVAVVNNGLDPERGFFVAAQLKGGSFGYVSPYLRLGVPVGRVCAIGVTADYAHAANDYPFRLTNGNATTTERRLNNRLNNAHGEIDFTFSPRPATSLNAKFYGYVSSRRLPGPAVYYNNDNNERLRDRNLFAQVSLRQKISSAFSLKAFGKFNWSASLYNDVDGKYPGGEMVQNYWQREAYGSLCALWTPNSVWAVDYSADYIFNNLSSNLVNESFPRRHSVLQSLAGRFRRGAVTAMVRLLSSVYSSSTRSADSHQRTFNRLSPSASVSVQPWSDELLFVRASAKKIFRMPTFNEAYFYHFGNQNVAPEDALQFNIGAAWQAKPFVAALDNLQLTADGYFNRVTDKIVAIPYNMYVWTVTNLGRVNIYGLDMTASTAWTVGRRQSVTFDASYSFQRARQLSEKGSRENGKQVAYTPRHWGSASVSYENPWVNLTVNATAVGHRFSTNDNNPATRLPGYADFGAALWRSFALGAGSGSSLSVRLDITNLFNRQYAVVARYPMPGRAWRLTLRYSFETINQSVQKY